MTLGREIVLQAIRHPRGWLMLQLTVALIPRTPWQIDLMFNTGRPQSVVSPRTRDSLLAVGALREGAAGSYALHGAEADGHPLPDVPVRVSGGPALLGIEGMLGLDFFDQFAEVCLDTRSLRLRLIQG